MDRREHPPDLPKFESVALLFRSEEAEKRRADCAVACRLSPEAGMGGWERREEKSINFRSLVRVVKHVTFMCSCLHEEWIIRGLPLRDAHERPIQSNDRRTRCLSTTTE